ncbi:hypothetical protein L227DRAFT_575999 [Lentinus tigrinus ALCF2SS1-6]|uniref:F-box domain-containing protein n=1 Tax=Lentinus tigrinus ALCF2SS1-6 TaxID=1328759 RepID=A0A5C2S791_9APHY|nr:hypothetical protein L227DRAFT_575999 [Lentinus tigrinus ALCF2SS1-6]
MSCSLSLLSLPEDLLVHVLGHCDVGDLFACKQVCRRLEQLTTHDVYLQYKIELAVNGMVDVPSPSGEAGMPVVERLGKLREHRERLRTGTFADSGFAHSWQQWPRVESMPTDGWETHLAFGSSISYVVVKPPQREISVCAPPVLGLGLPGGADSEARMRCWSVPLGVFPEGEVVAASVDIAQDLLLVVQPAVEMCGHVMVHLRSLEGPCGPHPQAAQPILLTGDPEQLSSGLPIRRAVMSHIQIHENLVAWIYSAPTTYCWICDIEVWDWKAGRLLWRRQFGYEVSFTLLDSRHIVVTGPITNYLYVYDFLKTPEPADRSSDNESQHILLLKLPPSEREPHIQESSIPAPPSSSVPFWTDPALRIVVVAFSSTRAALLIPYNTIAALIRTRQPALKECIPWDNWGPQGTLLLHLTGKQYPALWMTRHCYPYGSRVALMYFEEESYFEGDAIIYDLNPWAARYARCSPHAASKDALYGALADLRVAFRTNGAVLPHAVFHGPCMSPGFAQAPPILAMDQGGFTAAFTRKIFPSRFLGSISYHA